MRPLYLVLLILVVLSPTTAAAQAPDDTLPERVVARSYEAFNPHDAAAYMSFFDPRFDMESVRPDSLCKSVRTSGEAEEQRLSKEFAGGGSSVPPRQWRCAVLLQAPSSLRNNPLLVRTVALFTSTSLRSITDTSSAKWTLMHMAQAIPPA
jgi:hypothetical protein